MDELFDQKDFNNLMVILASEQVECKQYHCYEFFMIPLLEWDIQCSMIRSPFNDISGRDVRKRNPLMGTSRNCNTAVLLNG
jgi:hypothetical protein